MNTSPSVIRILCYGDSNTWGQTPDQTGRFSVSVRWTGVLQEMLGSSYEIIEEGLSGRTTDLDHLQPEKVGRNGKTYLAPCLASHNPIDKVVLMLGTNDLKKEYGRNAEGVAEAITDLVTDCKQLGKDERGEAPELIILSPIHIDDSVPMFLERYSGKYDSTSVEESKRLYEMLVTKIGSTATVLDAAEVARAGEDGIHIDEASQRPLAALIAKAVRRA